MRTRNWLTALTLMVALGTAASTAQAQGKGKGNDNKGGKQEHAKPAQAKQEHGKPQGGGSMKQEAKGKGKADWKDESRHDAKEYAKAVKHDEKGFDKVVSNGNLRRVFLVRDTRPVLHRYVISSRAYDRIAAGAVTRAYARGVNDNVFVLSNVGNGVRIANRSGLVLVDLDDDRARNLGAWDVRPLYYRDNAQAPAFCRSGAGHPVFGRQWCIDKGFGLGNGNNNLRWGRTVSNVNDIVFVQPVTTGNVVSSVLLNLLGNVAYDRLALHSVTMGYADPLTGVWIGDNTGPRVLQINSGSYPVAEIVDANRDNRADMVVVALRPW